MTRFVPYLAQSRKARKVFFSFSLRLGAFARASGFFTSLTVPGFPGDKVFLICHVRRDFAMSSVEMM